MAQFKKEDEVIIAVNRMYLFHDEELTWQGATSDKELVEQVMKNLSNHYTAGRRGSTSEEKSDRNLELNFHYKQPIPYMVMRRGEQFFVTQRLSGGGESRLHGKLSMGIGGHMNPYYDKDGQMSLNMPFDKILSENTLRELEEEVHITSGFDINIVGLINDDSDNVGKVHLGILGFIDVPETTEVTVKETEQLAGLWYTLDELRKPEVYERLENWGKIVVDLM